MKFLHMQMKLFAVTTNCRHNCAELIVSAK